MEASVDDDFTGMVARFATAATVIVPNAYLNDAPRVLARVASLANATGIAPTRAELSVAADGQAVSPKSAFLAADVALSGEHSVARLASDRLSLTDASGKMLADVSGLNRIGVIQTVKAGDVSGIVYRTVGDTPPIIPASLQLSRGDVAIVDDSGVLSQFDTRRSRRCRTPAMSPAPLGHADWARWGMPAVLCPACRADLLVARSRAAGTGRTRREPRD